MWIRVRGNLINLNNVTYIKLAEKYVTFFFQKPNDDGDGWITIEFSNPGDANEFFEFLKSLVSSVDIPV